VSSGMNEMIAHLPWHVWGEVVEDCLALRGGRLRGGVRHGRRRMGHAPSVMSMPGNGTMSLKDNYKALGAETNSASAHQVFAS
jgi:hypothetical protein